MIPALILRWHREGGQGGNISSTRPRCASTLSAVRVPSGTIAALRTTRLRSRKSQVLRSSARRRHHQRRRHLSALPATRRLAARLASTSGRPVGAKMARSATAVICVAGAEMPPRRETLPLKERGRSVRREWAKATMPMMRHRGSRRSRSGLGTRTGALRS